MNSKHRTKSLSYPFVEDEFETKKADQFVADEFETGGINQFVDDEFETGTQGKTEQFVDDEFESGHSAEWEEATNFINDEFEGSGPLEGFKEDLVETSPKEVVEILKEEEKDFWDQLREFDILDPFALDRKLVIPESIAEIYRGTLFYRVQYFYSQGGPR